MWDKLQHFMAYAVLAICGVVGFPGRRPRLLAGVGLIVLGCGLEVAQAAVPGRDPSIGDAVANIAGIAFGLATAWIGVRLVGALEKLKIAYTAVGDGVETDTGDSDLESFQDLEAPLMEAVIADFECLIGRMQP